MQPCHGNHQFGCSLGLNLGPLLWDTLATECQGRNRSPTLPLHAYFSSLFRPSILCGSTVPPRVHLSPNEPISPLPGSTASQLQQASTVCCTWLSSIPSHVLLRVGRWRFRWGWGGCAHIQNVLRWSVGQEQCCMMEFQSIRMSVSLGQQLRGWEIWGGVCCLW